MSYNGSGTFSLTTGNPVVTGTTISSTWANNTLSDIATGLSTAVTKDGQTTPTANIPMGGFKLTGLGAATTAGDALRFENIALIGSSIQAQTYVAFTTGGTSTAYTLTPTPAITAYTAGQSFFVKFNAVSGAAPTLAISAVATPPNLVKQLGDGTYSNIAAGDITLNHESRVTLLSATQAWVEILPLVAINQGGTGAITAATALAALGGMALADVATQAQQETATSVINAVTPGRQQYHPSAAKAWCVVDTAGSIQASYNIASVTDTGAGVITVLWNVDFSGAAYAPTAQAIFTPGGTAATTLVTHINNSLTTAQAVFTAVKMSDFLATDPNFWSIHAFGDQ